MKPTTRKSKLWLWIGGIAFALLLAAAFTFTSLRVPIQPRTPTETAVLFALSTFIAVALIIFGFVLFRNLWRAWAERRAMQPGARFKTRALRAAMAISLLPLIILFLVSYTLLNRTLVTWFPRPLEQAMESVDKLQEEGRATEVNRLARIARSAASGKVDSSSGVPTGDTDSAVILRALGWGADAAWIVDPRGQVVDGLRAQRSDDKLTPTAHDASGRALVPVAPMYVMTLSGQTELWRQGRNLFVAARQPFARGTVVAARAVQDRYLERIAEIQAYRASYEQQRRDLRTYKTQLMSILLLFTVLLLFSATWLAMYLSKQLTVPIQALAKATREVSAGNFDTRVDVKAQDELGSLVRSFNEMTAQLADNRQQLDEFTRDLQQAVQEIERRRTLLETILENIPTGVISLAADGTVRRVNPAGEKIFGPQARQAHTLAELLGKDAAQATQALMRRSLRMGTASKELEFAGASRLVHAAVTVSALGPRSANPGYVIVVDDLTELLGAQKAAAWQEVAQRIAHEIQNPLTPIQLSAQRLLRFLDRQGAPASGEAPPELVRLVRECAGLIESEVGTLSSLVREFSEFARFPAARLVPSDLNAIVRTALEVFGGRLEGIRVKTDLDSILPPVRADAELLRRVLVNLIDNAAESLEGAAVRELFIETHADNDRETVSLVVADSGHGISPEDKDKLFLPHFSTKGRGTGLGLAIASRILAEHHGSIRVEDNVPVGARFVLRIPAAEVPVATPLPMKP
ncbi:MAG TPA: ATP-binding protein [Methylomirabilota bacterium]|nr:ATP-binding protein [Methylomirabilota bacterium]